MILYLVRHGQTDWNVELRAQGCMDIPLNENGIRQAEELREKLKNYDFDICYCSPLKRARQTAEIAVNERTVIIIDEDLIERSFGKLEGTDLRELEIDDQDVKLNTDYGGIEPIKDVLKRSKRVIDRIKSENSENSKVLIVSHGVLLKTLYFNVVGYGEDTDFWSFHIENGEIVELEV